MSDARCFLLDTIVCIIPSTRLLRPDSVGYSIEPVRIRIINRPLHEAVDGIMPAARGAPSAMFV
jgi:hypothetical protein